MSRICTVSKIRSTFSILDQSLEHLLIMHSNTEGITVLESGFRELSCLMSKEIWTVKALAKICYLSAGCSIICVPLLSPADEAEMIRENFRIICLMASDILKSTN